MDNKQESPVLGETDGSLPRLPLVTGFNQLDEGVEEHFTGLFKGNAVFMNVCGGLFQVPFKNLT